MNTLEQLYKAPQTHWLRKIIFQIHLWIGILLSLYVLVISLSGTALLLKPPFYRWFEPKLLDRHPAQTEPLKGQALREIMQEVYAGYELGFLMEAYDENEATYIVLNKDGEYFPHYFNQYTGKDQGVANPFPIKMVELLGSVHADLFMDLPGRRLNGYAALSFVVMSVSGLFLWWRGRSRFWSSFIVSPRNKNNILWQLHSFLGFWGFTLVLAWGISGFQLGQGPLVRSWLFSLGIEPGDPDSLLVTMLQFFQEMHFGQFGEGLTSDLLWVLASTLPTFLLISGVYLWLRRKVIGAKRLR
jgi:uncharacterized iron-regulated membrane protein